MNDSDNANAERFVASYADMILRISRVMLHNREDAEDICQEVFLKRLEKPGFDSDEHEKAWLIRVTMNACRDHLRRALLRKTLLLRMEREPRLPEPSEDNLGAMLRLLPEKERIVLYLRYCEEYSVKEIASLLGSRENTVSARLSRGRKRLKRLWEAEEKVSGGMIHVPRC